MTGINLQESWARPCRLQAGHSQVLPLPLYPLTGRINVLQRKIYVGHYTQTCDFSSCCSAVEVIWGSKIYPWKHTTGYVDDQAAQSMESQQMFLETEDASPTGAEVCHGALELKCTDKTLHAKVG